VSTSQPIVVDLGMSDIEYLELLTQGRNSIHEQSYTQQSQSITPSNTITPSNKCGTA